jgi:RNA polymerase sigma-70 factor (ECF subfamily)
MLGSLADADDALQDALLGAWRGFAGFEGRSSLRSWLYRIATNSCLQLLSERPRRLLATERAPAEPRLPLEAALDEPIWLEPYPNDPEGAFEVQETLELAFVAALQHLPPLQRAALILREVVGFSAAEVAEQLETGAAAVESALQRARKTMAERAPTTSQREVLRELGQQATDELVARFVSAWRHADASALLELLTEDVKFSMPPIPSWFDGRQSVGTFLAERVFATPWQLQPLRASGQLAFACYQGPDFRLGALNVVTLRGSRIAEMCGFLDPAVHRRFLLPER